MARKTTLSPAQQEEYRLAVQRINKQLRRMEKHYGMEEGSKLYSTAYASAMRDIKSEWGDQKRFGKAMPKNMNEFRKRMNMIRNFYDKPSATLSGIKTIYKKHAETMTQKFGVTITSGDLQSFFDSGVGKELFRAYGSGKAMRYWKTIVRQKDWIIKKLNEGKKVTVRGRYAKDVEALGLDDMLREYLKDKLTPIASDPVRE